MSRLQTLITKLGENRATKPIKRTIVRSLAGHSSTRAFLNAYYRMLSHDAKSKYHGRYSKIFAQGAAHLASGRWSVRFQGATIQLPLRSEYSWLDWDIAVSILGHDIEVKRTYAELISSRHRPDIFVDAGANYGTHSLLFKAVGIPSIPFEPNGRCYEYFKLACEMNSFEARWEAVALGNSDGFVDLVFPERNSWHGSIVAEVANSLKQNRSISMKCVTQRRLDNYRRDLFGKKVLLKIDVEGAEGAVMRGASMFLKEIRPIVIFESYSAEERMSLYSLFTGHGYAVRSLPWTRAGVSQFLQINEFRTSGASNFIAWHQDHREG